MKHIVYLRSGKILELDADSVVCVDQRNHIYKCFKAVDKDALNKQVVAIFNNPDAIVCQIEITEDENYD